MRTFAQPAHASGAPTRAAPGLQRQPAPQGDASLTLSTAGDRYEREAEHVANAVMRMSDSDGSMPLAVQRGQATQDTPNVLLQTTAAVHSAPGVAPAIAAQIPGLRDRGQPLPPAERRFFEPRFGHDFSQVRIHSDAHSSALAEALHARAFTVGQHVVFGGDAYAPASDQGRRLLAHELTHVIQQRHDTAPSIVQREPVPGSEEAPVAPPDATAVEFQEHPSQLYHGFDPTSKPIKMLAIPSGSGSRKLAVKVEPSGAQPQYTTLGVHPLTINAGANEIEVSGTNSGDIGSASEIRATGQTGTTLDRVGVRVLPRQELTVGYHFMHDPARKGLLKNVPYGHTNRVPGDAAALTAKLNQVWLLQANIHFTTSAALEQEFATRQINSIGSQDDTQLAALFAPFASGAHMEVFLVWEIASNKFGSDPNGRYIKATNITMLEDGDAPDGFDLAHEAGHFLTVEEHTDSGLMAPNTSGPDRPRVQGSVASSANQKAGTL